ncbi:MAG: hypothetical protein QW655_04540 [Nitrososphaerota archaeon]
MSVIVLDSASIRVEHVIYAPIPYKGYSFRAKSSGADIESFKIALKDWLVPFDQTIITSSFLEKVLVCGRKKAYYARVFQAPALDELRRSGVASHIAEIDISSFKNVPISQLDLAMARFIETHGIPIGDIKPLTIPLDLGEDVESNAVRNILPKEIAQKIAEITKSDRFKIFILYRGGERDNLAFGLARKMIVESFKGEFIVASENIKGDVLLLYDGVLIMGRRLPPWARLRGWNIINLEKYVVESSKSDKTIDEILKKIYG